MYPDHRNTSIQRESSVTSTLFKLNSVEFSRLSDAEKQQILDELIVYQ